MPPSLNLEVLAPELTLAVGAMALLMLGVFTRRERGELILWLAVALLAIAGIFVASATGTTTLFGNSFIVDPFARTLKLLTLTGAAVALLMSVDYWREAGGVKFEFPILILFATTGMMMMISANDLIALYVGLELQSLALYVVAAFQRDSARSAEAGLKYFVLGALSSGMLLYGASLVYGFTGSTEFVRIAAAVQPSGANLGLIFGLVFLMAGFAFKISAVPFHMWTPDVYEGAPTPVTAFFASAPKVAALAVFIRVTLTAFPGILREWQQIVVFVSIASMALGAFAAHALQARGDPRAVALVETGARYQMWHALAMLGYAALGHPARLPLYLFALGILLFSFSLYALAFGAPARVAMVTPVGGTALIAGWLALAWTAFRAGAG